MCASLLPARNQRLARTLALIVVSVGVALAGLDHYVTQPQRAERAAQASTDLRELNRSIRAQARQMVANCEAQESQRTEQACIELIVQRAHPLSPETGASINDALRQAGFAVRAL